MAWQGSRMKLVMFAALIAASGAHAADPPRSVTFTQADPDSWKIHILAKGSVAANDRTIVVRVDELTLAGDAKFAEQAPHKIAQYRVCLAYQQPTTWALGPCAEPRKHVLELDATQSATITGDVFEIPRPANLPLEPFWFVIDVQTPMQTFMQDGRRWRGRSSVFAHSEKNVFAPGGGEE